MIVVKVELWSARTGHKTELARMHICNESGGGNLRDYTGKTFIGRDSEALDRGTVSKRGALMNWPSERLHVWNLVRAMLTSMGYTQRQPQS